MARVVILSPHLDDAVLSVGAFIAEASRGGNSVDVVTVFANNPDSSEPASAWDISAGFPTAQAAAVARRQEDQRALARVGARPVWIPLADEEHYPRPSRADVERAVAPLVSTADLILCPGYPLAHPDHKSLSDVVRDLFDGDRDRVSFYVEQPYAHAVLMGQSRRTPPTKSVARGVADLLLHAATGWRPRSGLLPPDPFSRQLESVRAGSRAFLQKHWAIAAYSSQMDGLAPLVRVRIALYELGMRGECVSAGTPLIDRR